MLGTLPNDLHPSPGFEFLHWIMSEAHLIVELSFICCTQRMERPDFYFPRPPRVFFDYILLSVCYSDLPSTMAILRFIIPVSNLLYVIFNYLLLFYSFFYCFVGFSQMITHEKFAVGNLKLRSKVSFMGT